jgi:flagella basal body P-ring formation protein FlgA
MISSMKWSRAKWLGAGACCCVGLGCIGAAGAQAETWQARAEQALQQALAQQHPQVTAWHLSALADPRQQQRLAERTVTRVAVAHTGKRSAVDLWCEGGPRPCAIVWFAVSGLQAVLSSARPIAQWHPVAAADFALQSHDVMNLQCPPLASGEGLTGLRTMRALTAGVPVCREFFEIRPAVSRGDSVEIRVVSGAVVITARAIAEQDAALGQTVRIRRTDNAAPILATVVGMGQVVLGDRAPGDPISGDPVSSDQT